MIPCDVLNYDVMIWPDRACRFGGSAMNMASRPYVCKASRDDVKKILFKIVKSVINIILPCTI